jgi:hypothetical protein
MTGVLYWLKKEYNSLSQYLPQGDELIFFTKVNCEDVGNSQTNQKKE